MVCLSDTLKIFKSSKLCTDLESIVKNCGEYIQDFETIKNILSGDYNLYSKLVEKYQRKVLGYCINIFNDYLLAEDATQEIFIKAYQGLRKFNQKSSFSTWLYRIAFNHCQDVLKKKNNQRCESLEEMSEREGEKFETLLFSTQDTSISIEQVDLIRQILSQISDRYRSILIFREIHGLTYEELAEVFDCSIDSIKAKLRRARQELQEKIRHIVKPLNV